MQGWRNKLLSRAGKEVLLKTVVQALPSYVMSVFFILSLLCAALERMMNSFYWGKHGSGRRSINWMAWDKLCVHKHGGGMGFRKLHEFNIAMLGKQGWRLLTEPNSLMSKVLKARYFPRGTYVDAQIGPNPSYVWRSVLAAQELIRKGARWRIGIGS